MGGARSSIRKGLAAAAVLLCLAGPSAWAQQASPKSHAGEFVTAGEGEFRMTMGGQNEHAHKVNDQTRYTLNGKPASLAEFKPGDAISVTTQSGTVLAVDATRPPAKSGQ